MPMLAEAFIAKRCIWYENFIDVALDIRKFALSLQSSKRLLVKMLLVECLSHGETSKKLCKRLGYY